jgi:hypothetical protein
MEFAWIGYNYGTLNNGRIWICNKVILPPFQNTCRCWLFLQLWPLVLFKKLSQTCKTCKRYSKQNKLYLHNFLNKMNGQSRRKHQWRQVSWNGESILLWSKQFVLMLKKLESRKRLLSSDWYGRSHSHGLVEKRYILTPKIEIATLN